MIGRIKRRLGKPSAKGEKGANSQMMQAPKADVGLPRQNRRRRSSIARQHGEHVLMKQLPALKDVASSKRLSLFQQKLQLCSVIFNFEDEKSDIEEKKIKRQTLVEIAEYLKMKNLSNKLPDAILPHIIAMASVNIFRALPPQPEDWDPEDEEEFKEPAWPHLEMVYEIMSRFVLSEEINYKVARRYLNQTFCLRLLELLDSEDVRERDWVKTIVHRIYHKFISHRGFIRRVMANIVYRFVYETEHFNGIAEILMIVESITNGLKTPLKLEHAVFLRRVLIPLHRPKYIIPYIVNLTFCMAKFMARFPKTLPPIFRGILQYWPKSNSAKQVLLLEELEELLKVAKNAEEINEVIEPIFRVIASCLESDHFQVAERALYIWNNDSLVQHGCLSVAFCNKVVPIIYGPLCGVAQRHWNPAIEKMATNVVNMYKEYDPVMCDLCEKEHLKRQDKKVKERSERDRRWNALVDKAEE
eukprot:TRINITY_DN777804_c0_g1_i1.p1 TRINITY_DN777804_c0_g1~~TRINITY_DN777804_c0_g1_i1.p1  ORF type:complete len:472 (+),score=123.32 TRINITY_DN777804_c0_g1_i1:132-1547(+)